MRAAFAAAPMLARHAGLRLRRSALSMGGGGGGASARELSSEGNSSTAYSGRTGAPVRTWLNGLPALDEQTRRQLQQTAQLPILHRHGVVVMPDCHFGLGATVGSVLATVKAVVPAAVGVDIGCGMMALRTSLKADDLPDSLRRLRYAVEAAIPHGRSNHGKPGQDIGSWRREAPDAVQQRFRKELYAKFADIAERHPRVARGSVHEQLGTLGTGNHFVEMCLDEASHVWLMLHSGSRGVGNRIGTYFIELAHRDLQRAGHCWPSAQPKELAYFTEGTRHFRDYMAAVEWSQDFARVNRELMMQAFVHALRALPAPHALPPFDILDGAVNCHHNYVRREVHFGDEVLVTRKGALCAARDVMGIIPGSMGAKSFIVRGKGSAHAYSSCSHGAGRLMSRGEARRRYSVEDHCRATTSVECRKDAAVVDETPMAYKPIDSVMKAQDDLVEVVHTLRQIMCVKG